MDDSSDKKLDKTKIVDNSKPDFSYMEKTRVAISNEEKKEGPSLVNELVEFRPGIEEKPNVSTLTPIKKRSRPFSRNPKKKIETEEDAPDNPKDLEKKNNESSNVFSRIKPEQVKSLYMLTLLAILGVSATEYYSNISSYMDYGAEESMGTMLAFLIVLYVLGVKFFQYAMNRVSTIIHLIAVFLFCSFFVETALEVYISEAKNITVFDHWYDYYMEGKIFFHEGDYRNAKISFLKSMDGLDREDRGRQEVLFLKSELELARTLNYTQKFETSLEVLTDIAKNSNVLDILDKIDLYLIYGTTLNRLKKFNKSYTNILKAKEIIKEYELKNPELIDLVNFEYFISMMLKKEDGGPRGLTIISDSKKKKRKKEEQKEIEENMPPEIIAKEWPAMLKRMISSFYGRRSPFEKKRVLSNIRLMAETLNKKGHVDITLNTYKKYLDLVRENKNIQELSSVYKVIAELYDRLGQKERAQVYFNLIISET